MAKAKPKKDSRITHQRRDEIIRASAKLFREFGFNGTSVEDIAKKVNLGKGGIYNHVKSKEDLLYATVTYGILRFLPILKEIWASEDDIRTKLRKAVYNSVFSLMTHRNWVSLFLQDRRALSRRHLMEYRGYRNEVGRIFKDIIRRGMEEGYFRKADVTLTAFGILGMCNWVAQWYHPSGRASAREIAETFADMAENMVRN
jgi:TetR/AcrR family transcriptional regulator, cholesterol catabolism regulator